ncbi:UNVERIFIED_CONTAM: hypothetical protein Sradi_1543100 [Sesamum radiatum]|uniref:Transposase-associated domain-containing protein n=1 Tax=Sesamum radiatum TaxID=300843 RepID=A0AAW2U999_SESRA
MDVWKNLPNRQGLTPQFQDGVIAFMEWAKSEHAYMDGDKIRCPCRKCKNELFKMTDEVSFDLYMNGFMPEYYNWTSHGEERVQEYFEVVTVLPLQDEQTRAALVDKDTSTQLDDATQINWTQRMVLDAIGPAFCSSTYSRDGAPDDGIGLCPLDADPSSYYYGGDPYDYVFGLADRFHDVACC